jgi:hypothetical protein
MLIGGHLHVEPRERRPYSRVCLARQRIPHGTSWWRPRTRTAVPLR